MFEEEEEDDGDDDENKEYPTVEGGGGRALAAEGPENPGTAPVESSNANALPKNRIPKR